MICYNKVWLDRLFPAHQQQPDWLWRTSPSLPSCPSWLITQKQRVQILPSPEWSQNLKNVPKMQCIHLISQVTSWNKVEQKIETQRWVIILYALYKAKPDGVIFNPGGQQVWSCAAVKKNWSGLKPASYLNIYLYQSVMIYQNKSLWLLTIIRILDDFIYFYSKKVMWMRSYWQISDGIKKLC